MSKEKQIEEMFKDVVEAEQRYHEYCLANICHACEYYGDGECDNHIRAEYLYNAGYRKQKEGEWKQAYNSFPRYVCTNCNHLFNNKSFKYCPYCGADMKGE